MVGLCSRTVSTIIFLRNNTVLSSFLVRVATAQPFSGIHKRRPFIHKHGSRSAECLCKTGLFFLFVLFFIYAQYVSAKTPFTRLEDFIEKLYPVPEQDSVNTHTSLPEMYVYENHFCLSCLKAEVLHALRKKRCNKLQAFAFEALAQWISTFRGLWPPF